jgi:hypothetical protein
MVLCRHTRSAAVRSGNIIKILFYDTGWRSSGPSSDGDLIRFRIFNYGENKKKKKNDKHKRIFTNQKKNHIVRTRAFFIRVINNRGRSQGNV